MQLRTALIGRGMAATVFHAPLIRASEALELVAMAGRDGAAEAMADPSVDIVVIATPNASHAELARTALEAGKHVVVDKPFTLSVAEADALIRLAGERRRMLTVFHNRRWDGDFLTVRRLIGSGRLGEVALFEAHWDRFRPVVQRRWREDAEQGAGLLWDLGPHLIDQALVLFGPPDAVAADVAAQRDEARADDYFDVTLHYGPRRVRLSASTLVAEPRPRFAVHGRGASFVKFGLDPQEAALRDGADPRHPGFGLDPLDGRLGAEAVPTEPGRYLAFYEGVAAAIRDGAAPPVDPADAREGLRLIELARRSAAEGRRLPA
jgi:scyllo-inositol 2-dehydrogenase (NADP+)